MIKPRIHSGYFGIVIFFVLCIFITNVSALENPADSTILSENSPIASDFSHPDSQQPGRLLYQDFIIDSSTGQKYVKDRVIVRFKTNKNDGLSVVNEKISMAHAKIGAKVQKKFSTGSVAGLQVVQLPTGTDVQSAITAYESNPDVLYAEPDYLMSIIPDETGSNINHINSVKILSIPNDEDFSSYQWSFHNTGQMDGTPGADINALAAWNISTGSNNVVVAVIDTGVLYNHSDLSSNIWNNTREIPGNGYDDDNNGYTDDICGWDFVNSDNDPIDDQEHGTHVSGTIGAIGNNSLGVAGVNWQVKIMPLKAFNNAGSGSTSDQIAAIEYANANGASVISNSWGGDNESQSLKDAIDASPAIVVCAAGNYYAGYDIDSKPLYPASYNSSNIISVAATDKNDDLASFSNFGMSSVDLAAPGTDIWSTYLDGTYGFKSGTSMATPHISGVAALVKAVNPRLSPRQIKNVILNNVDVKSSLSGKVNTSGRLNAYTAVLAAQWMGGPDKIGTYYNGTWSIDLNGNYSWDGAAIDKLFTFGRAGNTSVFGDWNGDGKSEAGVYNDGTWYLDYNSNGVYDGPVIDRTSSFGSAGYTPVVGDWDGTGKTKIGVEKDGIWAIDYNGNYLWDGAGTDRFAGFGESGDIPVVGDWDGNGIDKIGMEKNGFWAIDHNGNYVWDGIVTDRFAGFGQLGDIPVVGDWDGNGIDKIGSFKNGFWSIDNNGNYVWDGAVTDRFAGFRQSGDSPVTGKWS